MSKQDGIGIWVWNEYPTSFPEGENTFLFSLSNVQDNNLFNGIKLINSSSENFVEIRYLYGSTNEAILVYTSYDNLYWESPFSERTIDIKTAPPAEFLTILQANAVYQESESTPTASQYLDEAGVKQLATKTKTYVDNRTPYQIKNIVVDETAKTIDVTVDPAGGGA